MKNIAVNSVSTPPENLTFAKNALGLEEVPAVIRLSEGSLVASLLALAAAPLSVFITPDRVMAFDLNVAGNSGALGVPTLQSELDVIAEDSFLFEALSAPTKSKPLSVGGFPVVVSATINSIAPSPGLVASVMVPAAPSYTALSLVNKVVAFFEALETSEQVVIEVNQADETVKVWQFPDLSSYESAFGDALTEASTLVIEADYELADTSAPDPDAPSTAWE